LPRTGRSPVRQRLSPWRTSKTDGERERRGEGERKQLFPLNFSQFVGGCVPWPLTSPAASALEQGAERCCGGWTCSARWERGRAIKGALGQRPREGRLGADANALKVRGTPPRRARPPERGNGGHRFLILSGRG